MKTIETGEKEWFSLLSQRNCSWILKTTEMCVSHLSTILATSLLMISFPKLIVTNWTCPMVPASSSFFICRNAGKCTDQNACKIRRKILHTKLLVLVCSELSVATSIVFNVPEIWPLNEVPSNFSSPTKLQSGIFGLSVEAGERLEKPPPCWIFSFHMKFQTARTTQERSKTKELP